MCLLQVFGMNHSLKKPTCILQDATGMVRQFVEVTHKYLEITQHDLGTYTKENNAVPVNISTIHIVKQDTIPFQIENLTHFTAVIFQIKSKISYLSFLCV